MGSLKRTIFKDCKRAKVVGLYICYLRCLFLHLWWPKALCKMSQINKENSMGTINLPPQVFTDGSEEGRPWTVLQRSGYTVSISSLILFLIFLQCLVKLNVKLKPMLDSIAVNRGKWEELHQKRLPSQAASLSSFSSSFTMSLKDIN